MKNIALLSWNVRGSCSARSKRMIKDVVLEHKINLFCLQEIMCSRWDSISVTAIWKNSNCEWLDLPANGLSGGLIYVRNKSLYKLEEASKGANWIRCKLLDLSDDTVLQVVNVYSPQDINSKKLLWSQLANLASKLADEKVHFIGDFNSIRDDTEKINCSYRRTDLVGFNQFIDNANLLELVLINAQFT